MTLSLLWVAGIFIYSSNMVPATQLASKETDDSSVSVLPKSDKVVSSGGRLYHCAKGWIHNGQYCYLLKNTPMRWENAACYCSRKGGHLASIHTQEEQDFLTHNILTEASSNLWIGFHDIMTEGEYIWEDGSNVNYTSWQPGEPTGHKDRKEDCVEMRKDIPDNVGSWNDAPCNKLKAFICKKHARKTHGNQERSNDSARKTHGNQERSNDSGSVSATTFVITLMIVTVLVSQMVVIMCYRRLWLEQRKKLGPVVFKTDGPSTILSTEVDKTDEDAQNCQQYSRFA